MSVPKGYNTIIYSLKEHNCDGTAETAINTGLYLLDTTRYPQGWQIFFDFTIGENNVSNGSYLRCRTSKSPYVGFTLRRDGGNANNMGYQLNSAVGTMRAIAGSRHAAVITNDGSKLTLNVDGVDIRTINYSTPIISPLVVGGELSDDTTQEWKTDTFGKIYVHSLIITLL